MLIQKAARRYAMALYDLAKAGGSLDAVLTDIAAIGAGVNASPELARFLGNYAIRKAERRAVLDDLFKRGAGPLVWRFMLFLEAKRRMGMLADVCEAVAEHHDSVQGIVNVAMTSAFPLGEWEEQVISKSIKCRTGSPMRLSASEDRELIAGFTFRIGDTVYDYSVRGTLQALKRKLAVN